MVVVCRVEFSVIYSNGGREESMEFCVDCGMVGKEVVFESESCFRGVDWYFDVYFFVICYL